MLLDQVYCTSIKEILNSIRNWIYKYSLWDKRQIVTLATYYPFLYGSLYDINGKRKTDYVTLKIRGCFRSSIYNVQLEIYVPKKLSMNMNGSFTEHQVNIVCKKWFNWKQIGR